MLILTTRISKTKCHVQDAHTLGLALTSILGKSEAKRIADISANMKPGDVFHNFDVYLKCKEKEDDR